jgi:hypothetical protein
MSYYYWDPAFRSKDGLTLDECMQRFGAAVTVFPTENGNFRYKVIFLDETRDLGHSWMLWMKTQRNRNVKVTMYEDKKVFGKI